MERGCGSSSIFAYSIGNEIAPDIVRWQGAKRVEKFLAELYDVSKQHDPTALATYANFPSTEYLDLSFLDFATFNVYLHDPETFRRYLVRLMNRIGDRPLLLGELGMDTLRHPGGEQAEFLQSHLTTAARLGVASASSSPGPTTGTRTASRSKTWPLASPTKSEPRSPATMRSAMCSAKLPRNCWKRP